VEFHRARIMQKLEVRSAAELFRLCLGAAEQR
jgi:FixJ family two-component response regulator